MRWRRLGIAALVVFSMAFGIGRVARVLIFPGHYFASLRASAPPCPPDAEAWRIPGEDGEVEAWFWPAPAEGSGSAPTVIYAHGNGEMLADLPVLRWYQRQGLNVASVEFRGYGRSDGKPSEASIAADLRNLHGRLLQDSRVDGQRLVYHGRSLGGGALGTLVRYAPPAAVVLESTFVSLAEVAKDNYGVPPGLASWLLQDHFNTAEALEGYGGALLVLHGRDDTLIPPSHGERLAFGGRLRLLPGGHNDMETGPAYYGALREMLAEL